MARIHLYVAASLDGYIATPDGGVAWLEPFNGHDYGYKDFLAGIDTVVFGRATYDQCLTFGTWPYPGKRSIVLSSRELGEAPDGVERWTGTVPDLVKELRGTERDVWIIGGALTQRAFLDLEAVDRMELFVMPVLLGDGVPLWPKTTMRETVILEDATRMEGDVVRLTYIWRR